MAEGKKSFILYCDLIHEVDHLTDEEKGRLFQHLLEYVNDMNPVMDDRVILGSWKHIQRQLKRDLEKYEGIKDKRSLAGQASAEKRKQKATKSTSVESVEHRSTNPTVNDTVTVTVNDTVTDIYPKKDKQDKNASRLYFDDEILNDVFSKWMKMCGEKGKPFAQSQIEALQMKLQTQSDKKSINQVRQSLEKGWLNLRPYEETESKLSKQDEEEMDIAIIKHARNVLANDNNIDAPEDNRLRRIS
jgi:hypothetical protein